MFPKSTTLYSTLTLLSYSVSIGTRGSRLLLEERYRGGSGQWPVRRHLPGHFRYFKVAVITSPLKLRALIALVPSVTHSTPLPHLLTSLPEATGHAAYSLFVPLLMRQLVIKLFSNYCPHYKKKVRNSSYCSYLGRRCSPIKTIYCTVLENIILSS